jgi:predicted nucleotidyltransferase
MPIFKTAEAVANALRADPKVRLAILFGSTAAGKERRDSDCDIAVDLGSPMTADQKISMIGILAERVGQPIDLIDLQTVGEPLLGQILKHGIRVVGGKARHAALIRKHLLDAADFLPYRDRILRERRQAWIGK